MKTSDAGRKAIEEREGLELHAYHDSVGVLTIGYGHTSMAGAPHVTFGMKITQAQADAILSRDLAKWEGYVSGDLKKAPTQNEFDAMISLCHNIGPNGFRGSSVVKQFNLGNTQAAADDFLLWEHPSALRRRRESERLQFLSNSQAPVK